MLRLRHWLLRIIALGFTLGLVYVAASMLYVYRHERALATTSAPAGGRFTLVDGISVYSQAHGAPDAQPLLLVHGTAAWSGTWFTLVPALQRAGYRVIALDLPPFGYSDKSTRTDFSRAAQAQRLRAVLDAYGVPQAIVIGHSFGGGPALELALTSPERVPRLILVDAALGLDAPAPDPASLVCRALATPTLRWPLLASTATNPLWSKTLLRSFVARQEAITPERLAQYRHPSALRGATGALGAWSRHFACAAEHAASIDPARIRDLHVPLTLLWGADDTVTPLAQAQRLQVLVPRARLQVIPGVGHIPHIEAPDQFENVLLQELHAPERPS